MTLIEAKNVTKTFTQGERSTPVLHGINLKLKSSESLAILGGSGAGKSTLLHIMGTLDQATSGEILFRGESLSSYGEKALAQFRNENLGFVFQFHHLLNEFTALDNVSMPLLIAGEGRSESRQKAYEILKKLNMEHRSDYFPSSLSGGEQQRVAVARALVKNPALLLADEPTGNLDKKNSLVIQELFLKVVEELGLALIVVTHDQAFAKAFQRSKVMKDGLWDL